jgi:hypothetical protein
MLLSTCRENLFGVLTDGFRYQSRNEKGGKRVDIRGPAPNIFRSADAWDGMKEKIEPNNFGIAPISGHHARPLSSGSFSSGQY